jgi:hypothetical protein
MPFCLFLILGHGEGGKELGRERREVCTELQRDEKGHVCIRVADADVPEWVEDIMIAQNMVCSNERR